MFVVGRFEKVSKEQFIKDMKESFPGNSCIWTDDELDVMYESLVIPKRATKGSAGYDIHSPFWFALKPGDTVKVPTGIRVKITSNEWFLAVYPRSGYGFKYRLQLDNTVGIIDSDYYNSDNEGHIFVKITNDGKADRELIVSEGSAFCQGIFTMFGITEDDEVDTERNGGFGSTGV